MGMGLILAGDRWKLETGFTFCKLIDPLLADLISLLSISAAQLFGNVTLSWGRGQKGREFSGQE